jgi:hypothetical protein
MIQLTIKVDDPAVESVLRMLDSLIPDPHGQKYILMTAQKYVDARCDRWDCGLASTLPVIEVSLTEKVVKTPAPA